MQHAKAHRQNINREQARLVEMQYNLEILRQQGHEAPLHNQIPNQRPPSLPSPLHNLIPHHLHQPPAPQNHLFQPPLPPQRVPPHCIYSWQHLKDKILLNFQGFQVELDIEEGFVSCIQKEREPLSEFYRKFLQLKAQAPKVSDEHVIAQAIKSLRVGPLHSHLVRERPQTVLELYDKFVKFSKLEIQHFRKLEQQRKVAKPDEGSRARYSDNHRSYPKPVHNIGPDSGGASENQNKSYREPSPR
jgi:hypothetical protein